MKKKNDINFFYRCRCTCGNRKIKFWTCFSSNYVGVILKCDLVSCMPYPCIRCRRRPLVIVISRNQSLASLHGLRLPESSANISSFSHMESNTHWRYIQHLSFRSQTVLQRRGLFVGKNIKSCIQELKQNNTQYLQVLDTRSQTKMINSTKMTNDTLKQYQFKFSERPVPSSGR
jgi:hypothetical protein